MNNENIIFRDRKNKTEDTSVWYKKQSLCFAQEKINSNLFFIYQFELKSSDIERYADVYDM
jgi:hypothetical protein